MTCVWNDASLRCILFQFYQFSFMSPVGEGDRIGDRFHFIKNNDTHIPATVNRYGTDYWSWRSRCQPSVEQVLTDGLPVWITWRLSVGQHIYGPTFGQHVRRQCWQTFGWQRCLSKCAHDPCFVGVTIDVGVTISAMLLFLNWEAQMYVIHMQ